MRILFLFIFLFAAAADCFAQQPTIKWIVQTPEILKNMEPPMSPFSEGRGVIIRRHFRIDIYPPLPIIFFPKGFATPTRYQLFTSPSQTAHFQIDTLEDITYAHYSYLNCIGQRMKFNPSAIITLTGTADGDAKTSTEELAIARSRANTIKDYLVTIWGIDPKRITSRGRRLPQYPSSSNSEQGKEENRRVEISCDDWEIMKPLRQEVQYIFPDYNYFKFNLQNNLPTADIESREIVITVNNTVWERLSQLGKITDTIFPRWLWQGDSTKHFPTEDGWLKAQLLIKDKAGIVHKSNIDSIKIRSFVGVMDSRIVDSTVEPYKMLFYPEEQVSIGRWNQKYIEEFIRNRFQRNSIVTIYGWYDNKTPRYKSVMSSLEATLKKYLLPTNKLQMAGSIKDSNFDSLRLTPEGRMLSDMITIKIFTSYLEAKQ